MPHMRIIVIVDTLSSGCLRIIGLELSANYSPQLAHSYTFPQQKYHRSNSLINNNN